LRLRHYKIGKILKNFEKNMGFLKQILIKAEFKKEVAEKILLSDKPHAYERGWRKKNSQTWR
jgi:hypothetical protein